MTIKKPTYRELEQRIQELEKSKSERKRVGQDLRDSEDHLSSIFRSAPIGIGLVVNRELISVNSRLCEMLWYDEEELIGQSSRILYPNDEDFEFVGHEKYAQITDHGTGTVETYWKRKDDKIIDVLLSSTPIDLRNHTKGITFTALDITKRKQAEDYLKNFQNITSSTQDAIALLDTNYRYITVNKAYEIFSGIKEENFIGRTIAEYLGEDVFESIVKPNIDKCLQGKSVSYQDWFDYPTLGKRWVEITYFPHRDENNLVVGVVSNTRDITRQYQAQDSLVQSEKKYRDLFESNQDAITIFRIDPDGTAGKFLDMNEAALTMSGYSRKEFVGLKPSDFETEVTEETIKKRLAGIESKGHAHFETVLFNKAREEIPVEIQVRQIQYEGRPALMNIARDIRNRKIIENALRESEKQFRTLATMAPVGIYLSSPDGKCLYANPKWCKTAGLTLEQALGMGWAQGLHPDDKEMVFSGWQKMVESSGQWEMEYRFQTSDGEITWIYGQAVPQYAESGKVIGYIGINTDITERKQSEEAIKNHLDNLNAIFESTPNILMLINSLGQVEKINHKGLSISKRKAEDLIGLLVGEVLLCINSFDGVGCGRNPACRSCPVRIRIESTLQTGIPHREEECRMNLKLADKEIQIDFLISTSLLIFQETQKVLLSIADISEQKRDKDRLMESEAKYRSLVESSPDYIMRYDQNCRHTYMNPAALAVSGVSEAEIIGKTHLESGFPEDLCKMWEEKIEQVFKSGTPSQTEFLWESPNGEVCLDWRLTPELDAGNKVMSVLGISRDITESKQNEKKLRELEERFRLTFYTSPDAVNINKMDGTYLEINEGFIQLTGYNREDVIGKTSADINIWGISEDRERLVEGLQKDGYVRNLESKFLMKDGTYKIALMSAAIIQLNQEPHILSITRDITDYRKTEQDKLILERQLQQAQKMESIGRLAGGVAHDFNNMLSVILGHAEMVMEELDRDQPIFKDLQQILQAANRSTDITRQLLAFARKQIVSPKVIDLNQVVAGMLKMLLRLIGEDVDLTWLPGKRLWPVKIDPSQVDQILANLCVNAKDAIESAGRITVETKNCLLDEEYCSARAGFISGQYVKIGVSDNGSGMDKETVSHIFEPFFTTKSVNEGTGLGLATVYGIVKQNNGFVNVYSEQGQGTTFSIYLPRYVGSNNTEENELTVQSAKHGNETILLVEDEPTILNMTTKMLQRLGYTLLVAGSPGEAIRLAGEHSGEIHLILTDVVMPEMNGRILTEKLMSIRPKLKCLFMSGYTANVISQHGVLDDGVNFIQKPFNKGELAAKIRQALGDG